MLEEPGRITGYVYDMSEKIQTADPAVTRKKFDAEITRFNNVSEFNRQRGIIVHRIEFPNIVLSFLAHRLRPVVIAFTVKINFTNYDVEAPSVQFIDPITERQVTVEDLPNEFPRAVVVPIYLPNGQTARVKQPGQNLIASHLPLRIPFLCLPGIREYHEHTFHSNNPWFAHRGKGEGTLGFIVDQLYTYGSNPLAIIVPKEINISNQGNGTLNMHFNGVKLHEDPNLVPL